MPQYKLTFFNYRGRAEVSRFMFALAGVEYVDDRIEREQWQAIKDEFPFGQVPKLEVDGKVICQSHAIERYLAKQFGFAGKTAWDEARVDMIIECMEDYVRPCIQISVEEDETKKKEKTTKYIDEQAPQFLDYLQKMCAENGHPGYFVGNQITVADLQFYHMVNQISIFLSQEVPSSWDKWPNLKAVRYAVLDHPKIKEWMAKRPKTEL